MVIEFLGNPGRFKREQVCKVTGRKFGDLFDKTMLRLKKLKAMGYNVHYVWENDYRKSVKEGITFKPSSICHLL